MALYKYKLLVKWPIRSGLCNLDTSIVELTQPVSQTLGPWLLCYMLLYKLLSSCFLPLHSVSLPLLLSHALSAHATVRCCCWSFAYWHNLVIHWWRRGENHVPCAVVCMLGTIHAFMWRLLFSGPKWTLVQPTHAQHTQTPHTHTHTHTHTHPHTHTPHNTQTHTHNTHTDNTHTHTHTHTHVETVTTRTHTHTHTHTCMDCQTHAHAHTHVCMHRHIHTCIHLHVSLSHTHQSWAVLLYNGGCPR